MTVIEVDVISDVVCTWCYVGKRTLDKAIAIHRKTYPNGKKDVFKINWRPYYLGQLTEQSIDKSEASKKRFENMTPEQVERMTNRMNQIGKAVGINFKYGGKIGHTRKAHRLIHFCQERHPEAQEGVVEGLFRHYHEQEEDITDLSVLTEIATEAGLNKDEVVEYLASEQDVFTVDKAAQSNRDKVTTGVPTFLIQSKYRVDGAQDLQEFVEAFVKVRETSSVLG